MDLWLQWTLTFAGMAIQAACILRLALQLIPCPARFSVLAHMSTRIAASTKQTDSVWMWAGIFSCLILAGRAFGESDTVSLVAEALFGLFFVYNARGDKCPGLSPTARAHKDFGIDKR